MSEINFEELLTSYLPEEQELGDKIEGKLIRKDDEYGYLDIQNKLEGRIRISEIENYNVDDKFFVQVVKKDETFLIVSKVALERKEELEKIQKGDFVTGKIVEKVKGAYKVKIGLVDALLPFKQSGLTQSYVPNNDEMKFEVVEKRGKNIILSRLSIIDKEEKEFFEKVNLGDVLSGTVSTILDYGIIVDLKQVKGLLHVSELSWSKDKKLKDFKVGDAIDVKVIELDKDNKKIKLSLKQLSENPWLTRKSKYKLGQNFDAPIKTILDFGVVVELGEDEGFIHISDLSYKRINNLSKEFKIGDIICCEIIELNDEKERISLSAKEVFNKFWNDIDNFYFVNDITDVTVTKVKDFGLFANTEEGFEVFIPKSEFSWERNFKANFKVGDVIKVKITKIEKEEKNIVGSIKKLGVSPFEVASSKFDLNTEYEVKITDIIDAGLLIELTSDFKGLIPKKEFDNEEELKVNDTVKAIVFEKNENKNSILLSIKKVAELEERKEFEELMKEYGVNS